MIMTNINKITGKEFPLSKILSSDFDYYIPAYQRPYAWTEEESGILFDDLYKFYKENSSDNYFLGSIVLVKSDENPHSDVIDGQQRLTTLTILLACLAYNMTGESKIDCINYLKEKGNSLENLEPKPRLHLRNKDQSFFEEFIQNLKIDELKEINSNLLKTESQQHIFENCKLFLTKIKENLSTAQEIQQFCSFLITRCYLVVVYTPSQESAFRVFSVLNSRGLDLQTTDIIKADIIGKLPDAQREKYTQLWEDLEIQTSRAGFNDVFMHIRTIFAKNKAQKSLLEEFKTYVSEKFTPEKLITDVIKPYTETYNILKKANYQSEKDANKINKLLRWLNRFDNSDWLPVAIKFYAEHLNEPEYLLWFTQKLERLASYLYATSQDVNKRIERYSSVLTEIEQKPLNNIDDPLTTIDLEENEKNSFRKALNSDIYELTPRKRNYIILRLNDFVSDEATENQYSILTIEHVLPQTVQKGSEWDTKWPDEEKRKFWLHKIANLVPLTKYHNSEAQNYDFDKKKECYFKSKKGVSSYPLTTQVLNEKEWTPEVVEKRQKKLLDIFYNKWEL